MQQGATLHPVMAFETRYPRIARSYLRLELFYPLIGLLAVALGLGIQGLRRIDTLEGAAQLAAAGASLALAFGIYRLFDWARVLTALLLFAFVIGNMLVGRAPDLMDVYLGSLGVVLLLPSTKAHFAFAREEIDREALARAMAGEQRVGDTPS